MGVEREILATVDIALPEVLNAIWKHVAKIGDLSYDDAGSAVEDLLRLWDLIKTYPSQRLVRDAFALAVSEGITVYDALYIQLAVLTAASLATFDSRMAQVASKHNIRVYP